MAFVRTKKVKGGEYRQLVESRRVGGKPRQKVLLHLGDVPTVEAALETWPAMIERHRREAADFREGARLIRSGEVSPSWTDPTDLRHGVRYVVPNTSEAPHTREVRELLMLLGGAPEGFMYLRSAEAGEREAENRAKKADALEEKLSALRRLRAEGRA